MGEYYVHLTPRSRNAKTGPIPVSTTGQSTCPDVCPFKAGGCYAKGGPLAMHWRKVGAGIAGTDWSTFCESVKALPEGQLWRHNQAGDLPGDGVTIDALAMTELVHANARRKGFTYTHYPVTGVSTAEAANRREVQHANGAGFTVNLSANNPAHADALADLGVGPVVTVLPAEQTENTTTPKGRKVVVCPATQRDDVSCATCKLCSRQRDVIVGFPAHGASKRKASRVAEEA